MPNYDGTGPNNEGPLTGRGLGYCVEPAADMATAATRRPRDGRGKGVGMPGGRRAGRNTGPCKRGGPGRGAGGGRGAGKGRAK